MADSSYEKNLSELAKMKVADLKAELKQRGLPTTGNKTELIERLQLAIHDSSLALDENTDEILDEDAVLGDEEIENETLTPVTKTPTMTKTATQKEPEKRKMPAEENNTPAKKVILNRKNIIEEIKEDVVQKEEESNDKALDSEEPEKKVIKLSEVGTKERLEMRAKKFGVPLSDSAKKEARAARFNITSNNGTTASSKSAASIKSSTVETSFEVLKKRGERFGANVSSLVEKAELDDKIAKRKARFGEVKPIEKVVPTKIKLVK